MGIFALLLALTQPSQQPMFPAVIKGTRNICTKEKQAVFEDTTPLTTGDKRTSDKSGYYFLKQSNAFTLEQAHERHQQCTGIVQVLCTEVSLPRKEQCVSISSFNLWCFNCWMHYFRGIDVVSVSEFLST